MKSGIQRSAALRLTVDFVSKKAICHTFVVKRIRKYLTKFRQKMHLAQLMRRCRLLRMIPKLTRRCLSLTLIPQLTEKVSVGEFDPKTNDKVSVTKVDPKTSKNPVDEKTGDDFSEVEMDVQEEHGRKRSCPTESDSDTKVPSRRSKYNPVPNFEVARQRDKSNVKKQSAS